MRQDCEFFEQLMTDEIDGQLSPEHRTILQGHLDSCLECKTVRDKVFTAHAASELLRRQRSEAVMPAHLPVMIKQRLEKRPSWFGIPIWRYATGLTMVILLIAVVFVYRNVLPAIQDGKTAGIANTDAAYSDRQNSGVEKEATTNELGQTSPPVGNKTAGAMTVTAATTAAVSRNTAGSQDQAMTSVPFVLYSGSLADLKPIRDLQMTAASNTDTTTTEVSLINSPPIPDAFFKETLPVTLSNAKVLRVLTNSGETVRRVIIIAGFEEKAAMQALEQLRQKAAPEQTAVQIETVLPVGHARLTDLLGQSLYEQLFPSSMERQLTYLLIMIGG